MLLDKILEQATTTKIKQIIITEMMYTRGKTERERELTQKGKESRKK